MDFVPRTDIPAYFRWADVFVLPSICEGSALVIYEALASGLPVITTPNSGSVVRDNVDGSIVPIRSSDAIAECLEQFAKDADLRCTMGQNARENALQSLSWQAYAERLVSQSELIVEYKLRKS
jgi:glycosyltransferase involved in cell wall biosynthesis